MVAVRADADCPKTEQIDTSSLCKAQTKMYVGSEGLVDG